MCLLLAAVLACGCRDQPPPTAGDTARPKVTIRGGSLAGPGEPSPANSVGPGTVVTPPAPAGPLSPHPDELAGGDACQARLDDIRFQLLRFYATQGRLPETLNELAATAGPGDETDYTCPVSGQPYAYVASGLQAPGQAKRLVLFDPTPAHRGVHHAVLMSEPVGDHPLTFWPTQLNEQAIRVYTGGLPPPGAPANDSGTAQP